MAAVARPDVTLAITCDVADPAGVAAAIDTVAKHFGRLDALVNNAGIAIFKPILDVSLRGLVSACWRSISPGRFCARRPRCR